MITIKRALIFSIFLGLLSESLYALPIGFGRNQRDLKYNLIETPHFYVYHDYRVTREGQAIANSLEAARPVIESWFQVQRSSKLPAILSSTTSNASFANFITDVIEIQSLGRGDRDLAWHEYTHNMMYLYLDNIFGPAGAIIHLPWMPAWWIEGLAEATSASVGSDLMYTIERSMALSGNWPTYDKLHSLYNSSFGTEGYSISGAFVSYILRTYGADKLPALMEDFYDYTMPWWWPWTAVPFNDFMPLDAALENHTGKTGEQLYEEYKTFAERYWKRQTGLYFYDTKNLSLSVLQPKSRKTRMGSSSVKASPYGLQARGDKLYRMVYDLDENANMELRLTPNKKGGFSKTPIKKLPDDIYLSRIVHGSHQVVVKSEVNDNLEPVSTLYRLSKKTLSPKIKRPGTIVKVLPSRTSILWLENERDTSRLCQVSKEQFSKKGLVTKKHIHCPMKATYPDTLTVLGESFQGDAKNETVSHLWIRKSTEYLRGNRHQIVRYDPDRKTATNMADKFGGKPISVAQVKENTYVLLSGKNARLLRRFSQGGMCTGELSLGDAVNSIYGMTNRLVANFNDYQRKTASSGQKFWIVAKDPREFSFKPCRSTSGPVSPLLIAMNQPGISFAGALRESSPYHQSTKASQTLTPGAKALDQYPKSYTSEKADWHPRPVFAFPWIGAGAVGNQYGFLSVPLMDHLQNETVTLSALYGIESEFPNLDLTLQTNRFATTLRLNAFRRQSWNGVIPGTEGSSIFYFDERGAEFEGSRSFRGPKISLSGGYRATYKEPYIGDAGIWRFLAQGYANEFYASFSQVFSSRRRGNPSFNYGVTGLVAPEQINDNFKYDKLRFRAAYGHSIYLLGMNTRQRLGLTYGRTRGKRRPYLREVHRPLRTFVPGSGGGYNEINVSFSPTSFLTAAEYGDTQAGLNWSWTFPIIRHFDYLIHIFYLERLDFTAFFNYGNAWNQQIKPHPDSFVKAHGYNLDLSSDIKGVTVNLGLGTGQVFERDWELFFKFGFDTLLE
ncbi:MAG: hypothetical protein HRU19_09035 [Pseudobacteriovorax sp.]|nr:hypothetical protein [Pseudobacteriovorax sp.]